MPYEYKVIPAPAKGQKAPGVKSGEARFAHTLEQAMNEQAADGWEYQRSDILPSEERSGLRGTQTVYRSVLVFRRSVAEGTAHPGLETPAPIVAPAPVPLQENDAEEPFTPVGPAVREEETHEAPPVFSPVQRDLPEDDITEHAAQPSYDHPVEHPGHPDNTDETRS